MKRSQINAAIKKSTAYFAGNGWALPPNPRWDVTDFGLGNFDRFGLVLVNLAEEPEYCEKLMFASQNQTTPYHTHKKKKEDIICRTGELAIHVWNGVPGKSEPSTFSLNVNGEPRAFESGDVVRLKSGERVTLIPGIYHEFYPVSEACIIGEVSTANDDVNDNFFANSDVGRFSGIEEDEPAIVRLVSD
ncbi:MAG: D-lyxose/D-mannose family sugar isomerase [Cytophagales bacterium]|nr:D-lyxose/D-mannose family sugar isomerase [Cytophagales bacterium]